jgi:hypothetical protein
LNNPVFGKRQFGRVIRPNNYSIDEFRDKINGWTLFNPRDDDDAEDVHPTIIKKEHTEDCKVNMIIDDIKFDRLRCLGNIYNEDDRNTLPVVFYNTHSISDNEK